MSPTELYPGYVLVIDYLLGVIMWTLLGRTILDLFIAPDSSMVIAKVFRQVTNPIIRVFAKITPSFLIKPFVPVYVAWWFYFIRFYAIPLIFIGEFGVLSFPLESAIGQFFQF